VHTTFTRLSIALLAVLRNRVFLQFKANDLVMAKTGFACELVFGNSTDVYSFVV
jgi:hypothetical protein